MKDIIESKIYMCPKCNYISSKKFDNCPACSCDKQYFYSNKTSKDW
jgi:rubrerythrin